MWNKPKTVRTFSVPISCVYSTLNQRKFVGQNMLDGMFMVSDIASKNIWTPEKRKLNLGHITSEMFFGLGCTYQSGTSLNAIFFICIKRIYVVAFHLLNYDGVSV
jgi:hypothetical protein